MIVLPKEAVLLIGDPSFGGFSGGVKVNISNNDLKPNESPDCYNYLVDESGLIVRGGSVKDNAAEVVASTGCTGLFRHYDTTNAVYKTFAKYGNRVYQVQSTGASYYMTTLTEAGDASNQLSSWNIIGGKSSNTNAGVLYWKLTNSGTTRTVSIYKNSDGATGNLVLQGARSGDGSITMTAQNSSGFSDSTVTVAYSGDDTDLASNTLTYGTLTAGAEMSALGWFGKYFYTVGTTLYMGTTNLPSAVTITNQLGHAITGDPVQGKYILLHKERIWLTGDVTHPTYVYFLERNSYEMANDSDDDGVVDNWVACDRDDGEDITGFASHNDKIIVFKNNHMYFIYGDYDDDNLQVIKFADVGAYNQKTIKNCDGLIIFYGPKGIYVYSDQGGLVNISNGKINNELSSIKSTNTNLSCAEFWNGYYHFYYPYGASATYNDRGTAYDIERGSWMPIRGWNIAQLCVFEDETLHAGWSNEGWVKKIFYSTTDDTTSSSINHYWVSRMFNSRDIFGQSGWVMCLKKLRVGVRAGQELTVFGQSDTLSYFTFNQSFDFEDVGTRLANRLNLTGSGRFNLGDRSSPGGGSTLCNRDDILNNAQEFIYTFPGGATFREIKFGFQGSTLTALKIDWLEATIYLMRK